MKARAHWVVVPAMALAFGACNKKEEPAKPAAAVTQTAAEPVAPVPAAPETPAPATPAAPAAPAQPAATPPATPVAAAPLSADERAAKLGFARYLPADTESVIAIHNGTKIGERAQSLKLWQVIQEQVGVMMGMGVPGMGPEEGMGRDLQPMEEDFAIPEDADEEDAPKKPADEPAKDAEEKPAEEKPADDDDALVGAMIGAASGSTLITADGPDADSEEAKDAAERTKSDEADAEPAAEGDAKPADAADEAMDEDEGDEDIPDDLMDPSATSATDWLGLEVTFAVGKTAGEQLGNVLTLANRVNYFQMRAVAKAFAASVKAGDFSEMESAMESQMEEELLKNLVNDPESGIALLERASMPPLYLAFRTTKENQELVANEVGQMIDSMSDAGEMAEPVTIEKAGATLTGYKLLGAKIVEEMGTDREDMEEMLGAETVDKLFAAVAKKNLVITSGTLGDYVVLFVGTSEQDCNLVAEPAKSLAGSPALAFADAYAGKDLAAMIYGNDSAAKALFEVQGAMANYTNGLRDGLAGAEGIEDTRDLEALLQMVGEREAALRKLGSTEALGIVAFFEEGLKIESFGGHDPGAIDWKTPSRLAHLGDSPDVAVFASITSDAAYDEKNQAFMESIVETAYALTMKAAEMPMDDEDMKQFKDMVTMFNDKFRTDALALWDAVKGDFSSGLGKETALVVDLKGSMPTIPGVPQTVVDQAKFPRATMIMPVTDRAKLKASWTKINEATTNLLAKISEVSGEDIPMQKPISSEKDGYTTWFMSFPFQSNDFIPSVTVGDQWFAASTSKDRALELLGQASTGAPGRTGFWMQVDFKAFQTCAVDTAKILDDNAEAVFGEGSIPLEQFKANKELRDKLIDAMGDLDSLTVHSRREAGQLRASVHFKTR